MIGVIVAGHGSFASGLISTAEGIMGKQECLKAISVGSGEGDHALKKKLDNALKSMKADEVLILVDIFGGGICTICLHFVSDKDDIGIVTGVNLPMVLKVITHRDRSNLDELTSLACEGGREGIKDACAYVNGGK